MACSFRWILPVVVAGVSCVVVLGGCARGFVEDRHEGDADADGPSEDSAPDARPWCGNGECDGDEDPLSCPRDCGPTCGDGFCTGGEDAGSCPEDCPALCGDGRCTHDEDASSCEADCGAACGDGFCTGGEDAGSCPEDCSALCGDGACTHGESAVTCEEDCPALCGDGACTHDESSATCIEDCPASCGDGHCNVGEDATSCPADCPALCGDGACTHTETPASCPADCGAADVTVAFPDAGDTRYSLLGTRFWNAGDYVEGTRATALPSTTSASIHLVLDNGLTCDSQDVTLRINGVVAGAFSIPAGAATLDRTFTFTAPRTGPTYALRYETTRTVASGCGSAGYLDRTSTVTLFR